MSNSIEYFGVVYDEKTDWRAFVKDVLSGSVYEGLDLDRHVGQSVPNALGELSEALRGTPMEIALADAALDVIEHGNEDDRLIVESAGWEKAPNGFERMLALVERTPRQLSPLWTFKLYSAMFRLTPSDMRFLAAFTEDVYKSNGDDLTDYLSLAARYNVDWLIEHLPSLRPPINANMWEWVCDAGMGDTPVAESERPTQEANRARLLTSVAKLGDPYVQALVQQVAERLPKTKHELTRALQAHPAFARFAASA